MTNKQINNLKSLSNLFSPSNGSRSLAKEVSAPETIVLSPGQTLCGELDIKINSEGLWFHQGSPIGREELVKLFASILSRDKEGRYWLTTPAEKCKIIVDDVPFQAVEMDIQGKSKNQILTFRTNIDEIVIADDNHPIRVETNSKTGEPSPYIMVRDGLEARLTRAVFYQMVNQGIEITLEMAQGKSVFEEKIFGIWSSGQFFQIANLSKPV